MTNLLDRAHKEGNPLIDGNTVTFLWQGKSAPYFISDLHGWEENPLPMRETSKGEWSFSFELSQDAYLEYAFFDPKTKKRQPDPFNKKSIYNGVGGHNHFFYMPGAKPTPYIKHPKSGLSGKVSRHTVPAYPLTTSNERRIYLYHPPTDQAVPLLAVYDGLDYFRRGRLTEIVDNLIAEKRIPPIAVAFLQNAGRARMVEYGCAETTLMFVSQTVLELASKEINLIDHNRHPGVHAIMGASMGGLMSTFTALRLPHIFGKALSQSGAFDLSRFGQETAVTHMLRHSPRPNVKLWLDCGKMDFLLESNRKTAALLEEKGYTFTYRENGGAHNYTTWRNACIEGLEYLFV